MENEVHVWQIALDTLPPGRERILSASECDRMARFHFERDRWRYAASHAALRQILARYAGGEPAALEFTAGPGGKPALEPKMNPLGISFNLSHSGDLAMVAVARGRDVGVDVERIRGDIEALEIARRFFDPAEAAELAALAPDAADGAFFALWTRKEALLKARGLTLGEGLHHAPAEAAGYTVQGIDAPTGYAAAVAAAGSGWTLRTFQFSDKTSRP